MMATQPGQTMRNTDPLIMADRSARTPAHVATSAGPASNDGLGARSASAAPQRLRTNVAWTLAGNIVYAACQWLIIVVIARLSDAGTVGRFALGLATTAPVFLLAGLQLRGVLATDNARRFQFGEYLRTRAAGMAISVVATGLILAWSGYDRETTLVIAAVALSKVAEGFSDVYYGHLQLHERMRPIALSLSLRGIASVGAVSAVLWVGGRLPVAVLAIGFAWLLVLFLHDMPAASRLPHTAQSARVESDRTMQIVRISLPLGLVLMMLSLRTNIPRYVLEHRAGPAELGVYAAISSLIQAGTIVIAALGQAATPRLARYRFEDRRAAFVRLLTKLMAVGVALGVAGLCVASLAGTWLLNILFGHTYAVHSHLFIWLTGAGLISYCGSLLGYALTAARRFRIQLPIFAFSCAASALGCFLLIPRYGVVGAAWSWGFALLCEFILAALALAWDLKASYGSEDR